MANVGFNFRNTLGYVTDPAGTYFLNAQSTNNYPTTIGGVTAGYVSGTSNNNSVNESTTVDPRVAGNVFSVSVGDLEWRTDITGEHDVTLAFGRLGVTISNSFAIYDGASTLLHSVADTSISGTQFLDASGALVTASTWPTGQTDTRLTFSSYMRLVMSQTSGRVRLRHLAVTEVAGGGVTYNETGSGGSIAGGTAGVTTVVSEMPSGGVETAGEANITSVATEMPSGGVVLAGIATESTVATEMPSGGVVLAGIATESLTGASEVYDEVMSGGVVLAGQANITSVVSEIASGGVEIASEANITSVVSEIASGGVEIAGMATESLTGATSHYDPLTISGCRLWLDASQITGLSDLDDVTSWPDESGQGNDATWQSAGLPPLYDLGAVNGLPAVQFVATTDNSSWSQLDIGDLSSELSPAATLFVVLVPVFAGHQYLTPISTHSNANAGMSELGTGYWGLLRETRIEASPTGLATSGTHLWGVRSTGTQWEAFEDGLSFGVTTPAYHGGTGWKLGVGPGNSAPVAFNGHICEILTYDADLSTEDRQEVEGYLAHKWGFAAELPVDHPWRDTAPGAAYDETMSGGALCGGISPESTTYTEISTGGSTAGGLLTHSATLTEIATGGALCEGYALPTLISALSGSSGVVIASEATVSATVTSRRILRGSLTSTPRIEGSLDRAPHHPSRVAVTT